MAVQPETETLYEVPREKSLDSTFAFYRDPYGFIRDRCRRHRSDIFECRLLLRKTLCMIGSEAAEVFTDEDRFVRQGATPGRIQRTLFGRHGVQSLDGPDHRIRKQMFVSIVTAESIARLNDLMTTWFRTYAHRWSGQSNVVLYDELRELMTRAACEWVGVPLQEEDVPGRTRQLSALFDAAGSVGPRHWWARLARRDADRWIAGIVHNITAGQFHPPEGSPLQRITEHTERNGRRLTPPVAAVEVLNLIRPTIATSVFITFAAHALHRHRECRERLMAGNSNYVDWFVQEVRRFYPFFPAVNAVTRKDFEWNGYQVPRGRRVLLDLYGTDHDPRIWKDPEDFQPERFQHRHENPFDFIPQGPGNISTNHRCPGEPVVFELMRTATRLLTTDIDYRVPAQDLRIDTSRLPALPRSRFVISDVRVIADG